jgi:hypothetical protein
VVVDVMEQLKVDVMDKKQNNITEGMFSTIDQIRQDSKDVRDFVKKVFADREFKKMSNDKDFIKYLKSIYEGTMIDEEHVKFSNRTQNGTITTGSVQTTNESVNEAEIKWNAVDNAIVRYIKQNVKVLEKPIKARDEAGTKKMLKGFIDGLVNAQRSLKLESINEASIKGKNNKTGESFGMVIGSDKKNKQGEFEVTIRITYSSRISSYKFMFDKSSNLIAIKDYGYSMDGKFPDMSGGGSVKSVRPNPRETITQIAKVTSPAFAKKIVQHVKKVNESVNEASREAMGIAGFTGTRGSAVQKFIDDYNLNSKKLFNFVKKGKLKDRMEFVTAIAGKRGNKFQGKMVGMFGEGKDDGVPQGYNPMVEDKKQIKDLVKKVKYEKLFYDVLDTMEKKYGKRKYRIWLEKSLKGFGENPKHYDYRTNAGAEEKLFQLGK